MYITVGYALRPLILPCHLGSHGTRNHGSTIVIGTVPNVDLDDQPQVSDMLWHAIQNTPFAWNSASGILELIIQVATFFPICRALRQVWGVVCSTWWPGMSTLGVNLGISQNYFIDLGRHKSCSKLPVAETGVIQLVTCFGTRCLDGLDAGRLGPATLGPGRVFRQQMGVWDQCLFVLRGVHGVHWSNWSNCAWWSTDRKLHATWPALASWRAWWRGDWRWFDI